MFIKVTDDDTGHPTYIRVGEITAISICDGKADKSDPKDKDDEHHAGIMIYNSSMGRFIARYDEANLDALRLAGIIEFDPSKVN
jgi:hypothetical protein